MKIALCGNPNVGKTTLFNRLTRSDEPVGNWHGVTVDVRTKRLSRDAYISDLPGAYSLSARTAEEQITRDGVLFGDYDVIVYVAEANNLRRNLYMFMQLAELNKTVVLAVNMMDEARGKIDLKLLAERLGVPVIGTSVRDKNPKAAILAAAAEALRNKPKMPDYAYRPQVRELCRAINAKGGNSGFTSEFAALKIMGRDEYIAGIVGYNTTGCKACGGCDTDLPARLRYEYIDRILSGAAQTVAVPQSTLKIDKVALGRLALPLFLLVMSAVFFVTFELGKPISDLLARLIERAQSAVSLVDMPPWLSSLFADGIVGGVGAVLAFLPQVLLIFLLTALLQDSGYMSRVAFLTDDFFKKFGLSGRAAFSVVLGLGCSATAVLTTRGISGEGRRRRAAFATPFCPCSARLAVFTAISAYFSLSGLVVAAMYVLGFAAALVVLKVMQALSRGESADDELIMEMPPYRVPSVKRVLGVVWHNVLSFLSRVGTVVLCVSVIMWVLCNFSVSDGFTGGVENSVMSTLCSVIAPVFAPLGFGSWRATAALLSGVAAKEAVVSVISSLGGMDAVFGTSAAAVSFMIFTCLYVPCIATLSALAKENGLKSALLSVGVHTAVAYACSLVYYQSTIWYAANKGVFFAVIACAAACIVAITTVTIVIRKKHDGKKIRVSNK
ncbi:MAG: ferrous iron transport protein B [Clostridiales bacterium]|nr:ferrous iron transport protein B [Clostridiales bacterium]